MGRGTYYLLAGQILIILRKILGQYPFLPIGHNALALYVRKNSADGVFDSLLPL